MSIHDLAVATGLQIKFVMKFGSQCWYEDSVAISGYNDAGYVLVVYYKKSSLKLIEAFREGFHGIPVVFFRGHSCD